MKKKLLLLAVTTLLCGALMGCSALAPIIRDTLSKLPRETHTEATEEPAAIQAGPETVLDLISLPTETPVETPAAQQTVVDQEITLDFAFGQRTGLYTGQVKDGLPDGQGEFIRIGETDNLWTYTGTWAGGHFDGPGITEWTTGWKEQGIYENDYLIQGEESYQGSIVYQGAFQDGMYHGSGRFYDLTGELIYEGIFDYDYLNENAEERYNRADCYAPMCESLTPEMYNDCLNNPDAYIGRKVYMSGDVGYVWHDEDWSPAYADFAVDNMSDWAGTAYEVEVYYRYGIDEAMVQQGNWVDVFGVIVGVYSTQTESGETYSVPVVDAHFVNIIY